jgi:hypothetical protein
VTDLYQAWGGGGVRGWSVFFEISVEVCRSGRERERNWAGHRKGRGVGEEENTNERGREQKGRINSKSGYIYIKSIYLHIEDKTGTR